MTKVLAFCFAAVLVAGTFSLIGCASEQTHTATTTDSSAVVVDHKQYH